MARIRFAPAVAVLTFLLCGCGGPSATARFAAKVNALCASTNRQLGAIATPGKAVAGTPAALLAKQAALVAAEVPIDEAEMRKRGSLNAPGSERPAYDDAVAEARSDVALLPTIEAALGGKSTAGLTAIKEQSSALSDIAVAGMKRLGLGQCARNL
ncbi:MAG: hypothetical protein ABSD82_10830 [Solirubrobacteraceae bacterium]|jgi:hypothetical protein